MEDEEDYQQKAYSGAVFDALEDFVTKLGSDSDPNTTARIIKSCQEDAGVWYKNGGVAATICEFWADQIATDIVIKIEPKTDSDLSRVKAEKLTSWLDSKIKGLGVMRTLRDAELTAAVHGGSPLIVETDQAFPGNRLTKITGVRLGLRGLIAPKEIANKPLVERITVFCHRPSTLYYATTDPQARVMNSNNIVPFLGRLPIGDSVQAQGLGVNYGHDIDPVWGGAWIGGAVVQAAKQYEMAVAASNVLLQMKSFQEIAIKDLFAKLTGADAKAQGEGIRRLLKFLTKVSSNLSIRVTDLNESETKMIERSLSGVADAIVSHRNNLLIQCPDIPEAYLCQYRERGGINQGAAESDEERVDAKATLLFKQRWHQPIREIVRILLLSTECPSGDYQVSDITIDRRSGYSPRPIDAATAAEIRLRTEIAAWEFEQRKKLVEQENK
jgi:hypothetical protein